MQPWIWGIIAGVPILATGAAYAMGAFSTDKSTPLTRSTSFTGDEEYATGRDMTAGRRKKTKKSKSGHKKTKRRA
jgi:hypothetical protein